MAVSKLCSSPNFVFTESQLIRSVGMTAAILLSRIHYWLQKDTGGILHDDVRFVYNTASQWSEQLGVSTRQVERAVAKLRELGLLRVEKLAKHRAIRTNHYAINYEALEYVVSEKKSNNMSGSSRQNVGMYITKNPDTAKDINIVNNKSKAKERGTSSFRSFEGSQQPQTHSQQVEQVPNIKIEKNKTPSNALKATNTTVQDMIEYWNTTFPNNEISLNRDLAKHLQSAFKLKFNSDMNLWKHYCQTIETSPYLTGEGFKLTLQWALKFKTIDRIKAGDLGVKNIPIPGAAQRLETELQQEIETLDESQNCKNRRLTLLRRYGAQAYNAWIRKAVLFEVNKDICYKAETAYGQSFIENHFGRLIISRRQEIQTFEDQRKTEVAKQRLLKEIAQLKEPKKCLTTRKMLLDLLGVQKYKEQLHPLSFFLEDEMVRYTSPCISFLSQARNILSRFGLN